MKKVIVLFVLFICSLFLGINSSFAAGPCDPIDGRIVVTATGQQNCTSIQEAIVAASGTASPTVINVLPGTYIENNITMESYVYLKGAGREVTTIDLQGGYIELPGLQNNAISGFTLKGGQDLIYCNACTDFTVANNIIVGPSGTGGCCGGIFIDHSDGPVYITNNVVKHFGLGIDFYYSGGGIIRNNIVKENQYGMYIYNSNNAQVKGNQVTANQYGINTSGSQSIDISENTISNNSSWGINLYGNLILKNNTITNNLLDIDADVATNISFNVFDTINGKVPTGSNVKSDGTSW